MRVKQEEYEMTEARKRPVRHAHLFPVLIGKVLGRRSSLDSSTVNNDIDNQSQSTFTLASRDLFAQASYLSLIREITLDDFDPSTQSFDLVSGFVVWGRRGSLDEDDVGSGLSKGLGHGLADSSGS